MVETVFEDDRMRLRTWRDDDVDTFAEMCASAAVMQWLGGPIDREQTAAVIARIMACHVEHGHCFWAVERKADDALLGFCGIKRVNDPDATNPGAFEIGWRLREDVWGQGYARDGAVASLDLAFDRYGADRVCAFTVIENEGSWGLMERLGMRRAEALDFHSTQPWVAAHNPVIAWDITRDQWRS
ncbi:GNAT family N-acetyltransferase [Allosphingosinicella indica]|uniref:Protein N-acetyltransferase, RimJ/RimL family n=1 Tax=Allosphingosinicella indica TaxID=941907 RepID=A0A1X7GKI6_9SPHN|nr:GNAT family N-acetyltransferase [Allosphingosinicella indica]SMF71155.1 Protein N-acetyltransferase, RimJ/RimL family [Allosphingosinicella indica]